jgi:hypothetical protein
LEERSQVQYDKKGYEIPRHKHERQLSHRASRYLAGDADSKAGAERPGANGHDEVKYPEKIPNYEWRLRLWLKATSSPVAMLRSRIS